MVGSSRGGETSICMCINVYKYLNINLKDNGSNKKDVSYKKLKYISYVLIDVTNK